MAFKKENFSPLGASARAGHTDALGIDPDVPYAPQFFSYVTKDPVSMVTTSGYFNELKGMIQRGDWIDIQSDVDGTVRQSIHFFTADGESPSAYFTNIVNPGTGYAVGDSIVATISTGTVIHKPTAIVGTISGGGGTGPVTAFFFPDAGLFDPRDMPTNFKGLPTTTDGSGTGCIVTIWPTNSAAGIVTAPVDAANDGANYAIGDIIEVQVVTGTVFSNPIIEVVTVSSGAVATVKINDPGSFEPKNLPSNLLNLTSIALTGSGDNNAQFDCTGFSVDQGFAAEAEEGDINVSPRSIVAV